MAIKTVKFIRHLLLLVILQVNSAVFAQVRTNGLDRSFSGNDTKADFSCLDTDLPDNVYSADCVLPPDPNAFEMAELFSCPGVNSMSTPMVADLDGDGLPEIIACSYSSEAPWFSNGFRVFNGQTGALKYTISTARYHNHGQAMSIADVNHDGLAEIFLLSADGRIYCYSHTGTHLWTSSNTIDYRYILQTADVNNDGNVEVVCGRFVYNAVNGTLLLQGTMVDSGMGFGSPHGINMNYHPPYYLFALGDIDGDNTLELCAGNTVYKMTINNTSGTAGNQWSILRQSSTMESIVNYDGQTFLVDFDSDGDLDICVIGITHDLANVSSYTINVYVWDGQTTYIIAEKELLVDSYGGASIPYSGDLNGDGSPEIIFSVPAMGMMVYTYNPSFPSNMQLLHQHGPFAETCGFTVFDFNQDGLNEIVYRGSSELFIVNGNTLENLCSPVTAYSGTVTEYPVIADINADGHAEIIVTRAYAAWNGSNAEGWVTVYGSQIPGAWSSARKVWNQWAYNSVNINENLTVPQFMFDISTFFPNGEQPFNTFLHQMPYIDTQGNLFNTAPDVATLSSDITLSGSNATLNVTYTNQGDNTLNAPYSITVFANEVDGQVLQTLTVDTPLAVGMTGQQNITFSMSVLCQLGNVTNLVVAVNCAGGGIAQNGGLQPECDLTNNTELVTLDLQSDPTYITETTCDQYVWYGQTYTQSGQYETTIDNIYGCDSTLILDLTLHYSDTLNLDSVTVCDAYEWHGVTYSESGILTYQTTNENGCNRLEILNLTVSEDEIEELPAVTECDEYIWHGQTYNESGTYTFDTLNQYGCILRYILPLTVNHSDTVNYNIAACESYVWNGQTYSQSGNYIHNTTNEFGCSRLETLALIISDTYRQEDVVSECDSYYWPVTQRWYYQNTLDSIVIQGTQGICDSTFVLNLTLHHSDTLDLHPITMCDAYQWHGVTYTESGTLTYQTTNEYGCNRLERLNLTISDSETINLPPVTECDQYIWHGLAYTQSGTYTYDTLNQNGCLVQYILPITINHGDTLDWESVTDCDSYFWNGITITETGDYAINSINSEGCNRLERIHVTINYNTFDTVAPVTACNNYVWHEATYTQSGVYSYETQEPGGCLRTEVLFLTVTHDSENEFNVTSCESYEWFGIVYDEPGIYTHTLTNAQGCDSLLIMHLNIGETFIKEENAVSCGEYEWHGTMYAEDGDYQTDVQNADGCDSIFILHLTIAPTYEREMEVETCYSYTWVNEVLTQSGDYERHFSSVMGCDSLVTLHLTINDAVHHEFDQQTCLPNFIWNGITYYEEGDYEQTLTTSNGCDSIVTMHLHFDEQFSTDVTVNTCDGAYTWNGTDYFVSGVYQQSFQSSAGCDSIVNLHLNIADAFTINIDTVSCGAFYWEGEPLDSGTYQYQYLTASGCDSIVNLHLTMGTAHICPIQGQTSIFYSTNMMSGVYPYYIDSTGINPENVRWSIDRDDWIVVPHGASCDLFCLSGGQGILRAWTEGEPCNIDTTLLLNAAFFDVGENGQAPLKLYPNPTKGKITVEWEEIQVIIVYDLLGQKLMSCEYGKAQVCVLDLSHLQHSVYVLEIVSSAGKVIRPVVLTR